VMALGGPCFIQLSDEDKILYTCNVNEVYHEISLSSDTNINLIHLNAFQTAMYRVA